MSDLGGRPRVYDDPDELGKQCEIFFIKCSEDKERPTVTGLALSLGFASKQSLYDYEKNDKFSYPIKKALTKIEYELEKKLENNSVAGIIFALKNMGWKDKTEQEIIGAMPIIWHEQKIYVANGNVTNGNGHNGNGHSSIENEKISE